MISVYKIEPNYVSIRKHIYMGGGGGGGQPRSPHGSYAYDKGMDISVINGLLQVLLHASFIAVILSSVTHIYSNIIHCMESCK